MTKRENYRVLLFAFRFLPKYPKRDQDKIMVGIDYLDCQDGTGAIRWEKKKAPFDLDKFCVRIRKRLVKLWK